MLISLLIYLLISNAVTLKQDKSILFSRVLIQNLILTSILAGDNIYIRALGKGIGLFGGLFNVTLFTQTFNIFIFLISSIILVLTSFYPRKFYITNDQKKLAYSSEEKVNDYNHSSIKTKTRWALVWFNTHFDCNKDVVFDRTKEQFRIIEYALIIVFIICGAVFLISTADLVSMFLSIELQSYGLYILSTLYRNSESSTAGGLTYFLLGGLSSCFILLGSSLLYANSGTTLLDNIYIISTISESQSSYPNNMLSALLGVTSLENTSMHWYQPYYLHSALIIMLVGFLFKVSAAPFHFWSPDVYDGIPTVVTTYVATIAKISIFAFFMELVYYTEYCFFDLSDPVGVKSILLLSALLSLIIGSVLGLSQFRIKRLYAYSTISHVGFILLALSINSTESIQSYIFYILQYSLSNLNSFILLVTIGYSLYMYAYKEDINNNVNTENLIDKNNSPIQLISQIKGYFHINPFIAISLAITLFSFVGIPPLIGFFAKQMILSAALDNGYIFMSLVAILTSVIGAAYYLNLIKQIFFYNSNYKGLQESLFLKNYLNPIAIIKPTTNIMRNWAELLSLSGSISGPNSNNISGKEVKLIKLTPQNITLNSSISSSISIITLILLLFIYIPEEWFNIVSIITLILFRA